MSISTTSTRADLLAFGSFVATLPRRQRFDQRDHLVGLGDRRQDRQRDPAGDELAEPVAHLVGLAEDEDLLDQLPGHRGERPLAIPRVPALDHLVDRLAVAEPAEELLVDRHRRVGGEHEAGDRLDLLARAGDAEEAAEQLEAVGRAGERLGDLRAGR